MAWNKTSNKITVDTMETKIVSPGAPTVYVAGATQQPYKDDWDIQRAFEEGVRRITWTFRCVNTIAGNQARLPMLLRKDNDPHGEILTKPNDPTLKVLNQKANIAENALTFRHRVSSQLLLSTRGVFIEIIRNRKGDVVALNLLPPEATAPIPDEKNFVSRFEVEFPDGRKTYLKPENVLWIRNPHPLDPYLSLTPLEAAGIAVESENLARIYQRNFLMNDGRGGSMLILNGEIGEDDRRELIARHSGGPMKAGSFSVVAAEGGGSFHDLGSNPRDAAYIEMRQLTKEEILAAFGVPESILGNASGRTFSNAAEEARVFWMETMEPHLETIARGLDILDSENYVGFDTSKVPILILAEQERHQYYLTEFGSGLITANEYREKTGRAPTKKSFLSDSLLAQSSLTAIGNTKEKMETNPAAAAAEGGAAGQGSLPLDVQSGETPVMEFPEGTPTDGSAGDALAANPDVPNMTDDDEFDDGFGTGGKADEWETKLLGDDFYSKVMKESAIWENVTEKILERYFERMERVVTEKANGKKALKALKNRELDINSIWDQKVWDKQLEDDLRPVLRGIIEDGMDLSSQKQDSSLEDEEIEETINTQIKNSQKMNDQIKEELAEAVVAANALDHDSEDDNAHVLLWLAILGAIFLRHRKKKRERAEEESLAAYNAGLYFGGKQVGRTEKTWVTRGDSRVRPEHIKLHGQSVPLGESFSKEFKLRFPKDPLAPVSQTFNCRCVLGFSTDEESAE